MASGDGHLGGRRAPQRETTGDTGAGPAAGIIAGQFGYAAVYILGAVAAILGALLVLGSRSVPIADTH